MNFPPPPDGNCEYIPPSGSLFQLGETEVQCASLPDVFCTFTVTVGDSEPPVFDSCPADVTLQCGDPVLPPSDPTATDSCGVAGIEFSEDSNLSGCGGTGTITRTWVAEDLSGNQSDPCVQVITVVDTVPPVIENCPADVTLQCGDPLPERPDLMASDNCGVESFDSSEGDNLDGCNGAGTLTFRWVAVDACGNRSDTCVQVITVVDTEPPVIDNCPPPTLTIECDQPVPPPDNVTASDNCEEPDIEFSEESALSGCNGTGTITRTWVAVDACGNRSAPCVQVITVVDGTPPVITCPPNVTVQCGTGTSPSSTGEPFVIDGCNPNPSIDFADTVTPGDCPQESVITRTWTVNDGCGNSSTCVQLITIVDTTPPPDLVPAERDAGVRPGPDAA